MPSRGGVLVDPVSVWAASVTLVAVVVFLVRRRWTKAAEEVRRLVELAAEETARAEAEAEAAASAWRRGQCSPAVVTPVKVCGEVANQCAVCYSRTKTRCSRCKAVWYCSGRCQIIHWRLGHKDECQPPEDINHYRPQCEVESKLTKDASDNLIIDCAESFIGRNTSFDSSCSSSIFSEDQKVCSLVDSEDSHSDPSISCSGSSTPIHNEKLNVAANTIQFDPAIFIDQGRSSFHVLGSSKSIGSANTLTNIHALAPSSTAVGIFFVQDAHPNKLTCKSGSESGFTSSYIDLGECAGDCPPLLPNSQDAGDLPRSQPCYGNTILLKAGNDGNLEKRHPPTSFSRYAEPVSSRFSSVAHKVSHKQEDKFVGCSYEDSRDNFFPPFADSKHPSNIDSTNSISCLTENLSFEVLEPPGSVSGAAQPGKFLRKAGSTMSDGPNPKMSVQEAGQQLRQSKPCKILFPYELFVKLYNEEVELHPSGLANLGNSCYVNVVLQSLIFTKPLTAYLLQGFHKKKCQKKQWCFTCEFETLVMDMKKCRVPLYPTGILSQLHNIGINLGHGKEEDAHEFLRCAIDTMQTVCLKECSVDKMGKFAAETSLIQLVFGGYLQSKIKCLRCHVKSECYERMMDLSVEIQGDIGNLNDALRRFTSTELLDGDNKYRCDRCKSYERAKKKLTIAETPNILTIVLKRFQSGKFGKINKMIKFPETLNLAPYMSNPSDDDEYNLYAVVVHVDIMNAAFSGHYVCYVKSPQGSWYKADDSLVKPVDLEKVLSQGAYMLLYARCSPHAPYFTHDTLPSTAKLESKSFNGVVLGRRVANLHPQTVSSRCTWDESDPPEPHNG